MPRHFFDRVIEPLIIISREVILGGHPIEFCNEFSPRARAPVPSC